MFKVILKSRKKKTKLIQTVLRYKWFREKMNKTLNILSKSQFSYRVFKEQLYKNVINNSLNSKILSILNEKFQIIKNDNEALDDLKSSL